MMRAFYSHSVCMGVLNRDGDDVAHTLSDCMKCVHG